MVTVKNRLKKGLKWIMSPGEYPEMDTSKHKVCEECGGSGLDFVAGPCIDCEGKGFVNKTDKELWEDKFKEL